MVNSVRRPGSAGPDPELLKVRKQVRRLRTKLADSEAEAKTLRSELGRTRDSVRDPDPTVVLPDSVTQTIAQVRGERLTYLKEANLAALARIVVGLEQHQAPGLIIEAGTARGGSAIVMAAAKAAERPMKVYDVFGMIPPPTDKDGADVHHRYEIITRGESKGVAGDTYYGYRDDLYTEVTESFARLGVEVGAHNVELLQGLFADTLVLDEPVALAHLDGDWYESTMTCLERIAPLLVPGGRIVLDDYYAWSGCRTAVDEYFAGRAGFRIERRAKVHVVRL
jgi:asparagine synthase (glutamine-hydrolysing)